YFVVVSWELSPDHLDIKITVTRLFALFIVIDSYTSENAIAHNQTEFLVISMLPP
ncbi:hypothetical protein GWI33_023388, partial [Rhynchophorus ferrugineus]